MSDPRFELVGAKGPKQYFSRLPPGRLSHGYLFTGIEGIGKKTFARRLAQSLLCDTAKASLLGYCGECSACRRVQAQTHPDLFISSGPLKIGERESSLAFHETEEMTARDLVRQLSLASYSGGWRVFILGDVDFATHHAANALLQFLEEPPAHVLLLLTTATPGRLIPTIRSRLIEVAFPALAKAQVEEILFTRGVALKDASVAAALSQGSVARALAVLEGGEEGTRAAATGWFFEVVRGKAVETAWASRDTLDEGLQTIRGLLRDWIVLSVSNGKGSILAVDERARLTALPHLPSENATRALVGLSETQHIARTNVRPELVAEMVRMYLTGLAA
ncbi:MAG: hypothetical protein M3160_03460 [Candidatus Eremiobacteraeota bacterium]|nr:hypothetical protein [Candidatus Eremiobacteraeota bacterium]